MIEDNFNLAANYIQSHHQEFSKEHLLKFYGFYKQSTAGQLDVNKNPRPSFFRITEKTKWEAWNALGSITKEESMSEYIKLLTELKPNWNDDSEDKSKLATIGISVSRPKTDGDIPISDADKTIEDYIREGNLKKLHELLSTIHEENELNSLDENGMGLIHWASDRGNSDVLELILSQKGINVNLVDNDHQTALHYASSCGHKSCISLLLKYNADKNILDNDEFSCADVAFDSEIKKMLC